MIWLKENWFRLACLLIILLIGLGFVNYLNTKERNRQAEEADKQLQAKIEAQQKQEIENKKYLAERKADCLAIYKNESGQWSNELGWRYNELNDKCYIRYKEQVRKTEAECEKMWTLNGDPVPALAYDLQMCKDGEFENSF